MAAFFSAKMTTTQQNYLVHKQEMLASIKGMLRFRDILQGAKFTWLTDHKGLIHLSKQKSLSGRQACWLEKISEFDFHIEYVPGEDNILPDTLSRLYASDAPGTVRTASEYVHLADQGLDAATSSLISMPVLVASEAGRDAAGPSETVPAPWRSDRPNKGIPRERLDFEVTAKPRQSLAPRTDVHTNGAPGLPGGHRKPREQRPVRTPLAPVETGHAETAAEFTRRVRGRFVLCGPCERTVGGDGETTPTTTQNTTPSAHNEPVLPGNSDDNPAEREFHLPR